MRVDEHTIDLAGVPVFYRSAGEQRSILYLHGVPTSSGDWTAFLELTGGIAPDLPGFGRSAKAGHLDYSTDGLTAFLERLTGELGIDRVSLVMHDWGAGPGLTFAQRHPERVQRLVLMDAPPLLPGFAWPWFARLWRRRGVGELAMGATTRRLLARILRQGGFPGDRLDTVWQQFDQGTQRAILRLYRSVPAGGLDLAPQPNRPALVLWGERDPWLPVALGQAYARLLPGAAFDTIPDAGHWPWFDQPSTIDTVARFLG